MNGGLLPSQISVLASVLADPAVTCAAHAGVDVDQFKQWSANLELFLQSNFQRLAHCPFVVKLETTATGKAPLTIADVARATGASTPVVVVDWQLRVVRLDPGLARATESCQRTKSGGVEVLVAGSYAYFITAGSTVAEVDFVDQRKGPPLGDWLRRPIADFSRLLHDHVVHDVRKEKSFRYWSPKGNRTLLASPESTEKIFQRALFNWLDRNVIDKIKVVCETRGFGQDPADVLVITAGGSHIVEIKWLGKNENGTSWDNKRIEEGLHQVGQYLDNDADLLCGHLVVYDARDREKHDSDSAWDAGDGLLYTVAEPDIALMEAKLREWSS